MELNYKMSFQHQKDAKKHILKNNLEGVATYMVYNKIKNIRFNKRYVIVPIKTDVQNSRFGPIETINILIGLRGKARVLEC